MFKFVQILILFVGLGVVTPYMGGSKREGHLPGQLQANNWWKLMSQIYSPAGKQNVASPKHDNKFVQISPYGKASMFVISKLFIMANRVNGKCGKTTAPAPDVSHYNVGGQKAQHGQFPWQVALSYSPDVRSSFRCGGSYISKGWHGNVTVLTSAYCVKPFLRKGRTLYVTFNLHNLSDTTNSITWSVNSTRILRHPDSNRRLQHDVALVFLDRPVSDMVAEAKPICLSDVDMKNNETGFVSGWGTTNTSSGAPMSQNLVSVPEKFVSLKTCQQQYVNIRRVTDDMLCAGSGGKDMCKGDVGGPLAVHRNGTWFLTGVVSWGYGCGNPGYPGVYASVSKHYNWIVSNL